MNELKPQSPNEKPSHTRVVRRLVLVDLPLPPSSMTEMEELEEAEVTLEDYFQASGISQDAFLADLRSQAQLSITNRLLLEAVAEAEEIEVTDEDMSNALQSLAAQSGDRVGCDRFHFRSQPISNLSQQLITNVVSPAIVHGLEAVEI